MDIGAGTVPKGAQTSDYYRTFNIPDRFDNPGKSSLKLFSERPGFDWQFSRLCAIHFCTI